MLRFPIPLIICLFVFSARADPTELPKCEGLRDILAFASCLPIVNEMKQYTSEHKGEHSNQEVLKNMTVLCKQVSNCLRPIHCQEAVEVKVTLDKSCEMLYFAEDNNLKCLEDFFTAVYLAQSSNETSCLQKYDFLEKDLTKRHKAYSNGESCFIEYTIDHCNKSSIDYFSKNYKTFADSISIKPPGTECKTAHNQLNVIQCKAIGIEAGKRVADLKGIKIEPNDTRVENAIKLCRDTQTCMADSCLFPVSMQQRLSESCDLLQMAQSSFGVCLSGIMLNKPDLSEFQCLGEMDFFERGPRVTCQKYTTKKECMKEIMTSLCGKESVADFDMVAEKVAKQLGCNEMFF